MNPAKIAIYTKYTLLTICCFLGLYSLYSAFYGLPPIGTSLMIHKAVQWAGFAFLSMIAYTISKIEITVTNQNEDEQDLSGSN